jgi:hypothetical protein
MQTHKPLRMIALAAIPLITVAAVGAAPGAGPSIVRSVTAGFGLSGGGTGDVTLAVDPSVIQQRVTGSCGAGAAIGAITQNGGVTCQAAGPIVTAFVHHATADTIPEVEPGVTIIDNPLTNGDPNAVLVVTARVRDPGGSNLVDSHPLAVQYVTSATCPSCSPVLLERWQIRNADSSVMTVGADFNVLVVIP